MCALRWAGGPNTISASHPLGDVEILDEYLTERLGLTKAPIDEINTIAGFIKPSESMYKCSAKAETNASRGGSVVLMMDAEEQLVGIVGEIPTGPSFSFGPSVSQFMRYYWERIGGEKLEFRNHAQNIGSARVQYQEARISSGQVDGTWTRNQTFIQVRIHLALARA